MKTLVPVCRMKKTWRYIDQKDVTGSMGLATDDFDAVVVSIIRQYVDDIKEGAVTTKQSSGGKYTSVSVDFNATSKQQIEDIYQALMDHEQVKYIL